MKNVEQPEETCRQTAESSDQGEYILEMLILVSLVTLSLGAMAPGMPDTSNAIHTNLDPIF